MSQVFDPYSSWLDIPPRDHPPDHYALLGLQPFEPDGQVIREAARRRADRVRPHRVGEHAEVCERLLYDLSAASECLLDPGKKSDYDTCLREAQRMDDTRSMSAGNLGVEAEGAEPKPLRWGEAAGKRSAATSPQPQARGPDGDEPDADTQSSFGSDSSSAGSSGGLTAAETAADQDRQPLINVVVVSSGVGILLVAALGLLVGLFATGHIDSADDGPLESASSMALADNTNPPPASTSPVDSATAASGETPSGETAVSPSTDSDNVGEESEDPPSDSLPAPPTPTRLPLPDLDEYAQLLEQIEREFQVDPSFTRNGILDLAEQLIEQARESSQSPERRLAILLKAAQLAGESGDPVLAFSAAHVIRTVFEIDDSQIQHVLAGILGNRLDEGRQRWQRLVDAQQVLTTEPADPPANLEIGRYYCFLRDDWPRGLPHLAGGENTALRLLAERELAGNKTWQQRLDLGDGWWSVSLLADPEAKVAEQERAARWYRLALPDLEGVDKRRVQSRLASLIALPETVPTDGAIEAGEQQPPTESEEGGPESAPENVGTPTDLSGTWRSDRFDSVFRLGDRGSTVSCEVVSSKMVAHVDGLWIRDKGQLLCDRWRFRFVDDPTPNRTWDLGCEPKVVDEKTIQVRAEVVEWDRRGRETDRRWETATWKREE